MRPEAVFATADDTALASFDRSTRRARFDGGETAAAPGLQVQFSGRLFEVDELAARLGTAVAPPAALVLRAYQQLGDRWIDALRGHFAIVVHDESRDRLIAVRDRMGLHPLFFAEGADRVYVSWSTERLREQPGVPQDLNRLQLAEHLLGRWPVPSETYYAGIRRVMPGHAIEATGHGVRMFRYWDPAQTDPFTFGEEEGQARFEDALERAVRRCLQSGPSAINLSGGLDSISIAAVAVDIAAKEQRPRPLALSLGFPDPACDEEFVQRSAAQSLGLDQIFVKFGDAVSPEGLFLRASQLSSRLGSPLSNFWLPAYQHLARQARDRGRTVVLTGTGGDEWLNVSPYLAADFIRGGQFGELAHLLGINLRSYRMPALATLYMSLWTFGVRPLITMNAARLAPSWFNGRRQRKMAGSVLPWVAPDPALRAQMNDRAELTLAPPIPFKNSFYQREMRISLDHALVTLEFEELFESGRETGVTIMHPYLDADLVELLYRMPTRVLARGRRAKGLVRDTVARRLPGLGFDRQRKINATDFYQTTLRREGPAAWEAVGRGDALADLGVVDGPRLNELMGRLSAGLQPKESYRIWTVLNLASWSRPRYRPANRRG